MEKQEPDKKKIFSPKPVKKKQKKEPPISEELLKKPTKYEVDFDQKQKLLKGLICKSITNEKND